MTGSTPGCPAVEAGGSGSVGAGFPTSLCWWWRSRSSCLAPPRRTCPAAGPSPRRWQSPTIPGPAHRVAPGRCAGAPLPPPESGSACTRPGGHWPPPRADAGAAGPAPRRCPLRSPDSPARAPGTRPSASRRVGPHKPAWRRGPRRRQCPPPAPRSDSGRKRARTDATAAHFRRLSTPRPAAAGTETGAGRARPTAPPSK